MIDFVVVKDFFDLNCDNLFLFFEYLLGKGNVMKIINDIINCVF